MVEYDPTLIEIYAQRLYDEAAGITIIYTLVFMMIGAVGGVFVPMDGAWLIGGVTLGLIGYWQARGKVFDLKLRAQLALCQLQMERNTYTMVSQMLAGNTNDTLPTSERMKRN